MQKSEEEGPICTDCKGMAYVGGVSIYQCMYGGPSKTPLAPNVRADPTALDTRIVEERIPVQCARFDIAPREIRAKIKEYIEVGITTVFGNGSVQIPSAIRAALRINDGDKILWIRKGLHEYTFRKIGGQPGFKPHYT